MFSEGKVVHFTFLGEAQRCFFSLTSLRVEKFRFLPHPLVKFPEPYLTWNFSTIINRLILL